MNLFQKQTAFSVSLLLFFCCFVGESQSQTTKPSQPSTTKPSQPSAAIVKVPVRSRPVAGKATKKRPRWDVRALRAALESTVKKDKQPGIGVAVVTREKVLWAGGVGVANLAKKTPVGLDTMFRMGSVSKMIVALGFLKLLEQGKADLHALVRKLAPDVAFHNAWAQEAPLRLVHLLEHTSGFDDMHFNELYNLKDLPNLGMKQALAVNPKSRRMRWKPGTWVSYSNPGYALAGYILGKLAGVPFEDFVRKEILVPLGMSKASFRLTKAIQKVLAQGYEDPNNKPAKYYPIYLRPSGSFHASPRDLAALLQFFLRRGKTVQGKQLLSSRSIDRMERPTTAFYVRSTPMKHGYGLGNYSEFIHGHLAQGHNGGIDGFLSELKYFPKLGVGYALVMNRSGISGYKSYRAVSKLLRNFVTGSSKSSKAPRLAKQPTDLKRWAGTYQMAHVRNQLVARFMSFSWIRVSEKKNKLYFQRAGLLRWSRPVEMIPVAPNLYRLPKQNRGQMSLAQRDNQAVLFLSGSIGATGFVRRASWKPMTYMWLAFLIGMSILSSLGFALIWGLRKILGQMEEVHYWRARVLPFVASLCLVAALLTLSGLPLIDLTYPNVRTVGFAFLTWCYVVLTCFGLWASVRSFSVEGVHPGVRWHSLMVSFSHLGTVLFMWPWIGLRTWAGW